MSKEMINKSEEVQEAAGTNSADVKTSIKVRKELRDAINKIVQSDSSLSQDIVIEQLLELRATQLRATAMSDEDGNEEPSEEIKAEEGDSIIDEIQEMKKDNIQEIQSSKKELKRLIYRMIKELCRITDEDIDDPDSRISAITRADDMLYHSEKYGGRKYY